ncbi:polysaccharide deacetylase family protein [Clostridium sp. E02]|uniref:polysaccharide deacetylase family protein n=1 Tax=Clostridium sp. E02 TaxID=2487134 RepID=UPI000F53E705|nr:polysaccharide deacetylase family protein [Clostridium sp. E02]
MKIVQLVFPEGKRKAFTLSYDDGVRQDERLLRLMKKYGIKGTFNLNSDLLGIRERAVIDNYDTDISKFEKQEIKNIYQGQEIAAHALTHMKLTDISSQTAAYQILKDRKNLEQITGDFVQGFAYPFGCYDSKVVQVLENCGIEYARTVERTGRLELPKDFLTWHPTCHHNDLDFMYLIEKFTSQEGLFGEPQLFYLWGHAYEFDQKDNWNVIEEAFSYMDPFRDKIWRATNREICNYVTQFQRLKFSADGNFIYNPTAYDLWLSIDDEVYCIASGQKLITNSNE